MATELQPATPLPSPNSPDAKALADKQSLAQRINSFYGHYHDFLLWLIANPGKPQAEGMRNLGLQEETLYSWRRDCAGFKECIAAIQDYHGDLRSEAARTLLAANVVPLARAMLQRGLSPKHKDGQRAAERILETVGVLPKGNEQLQQAPIQVVTHTYVLVQPQSGNQGTIIETQAKELPPPKTTEAS